MLLIAVILGAAVTQQLRCCATNRKVSGSNLEDVIEISFIDINSLRIGIHWREKRLISKLYMQQKVKVRVDRGET